MTFVSQSGSGNSDLHSQFETLLNAYSEFLQRRGFRWTGKHVPCALHFLIWLKISDIALEVIDGAVIHRFLQHECDCCKAAPRAQVATWLKRHYSCHLMWFVRFLEQGGMVDTPGELKGNLEIVNGFIAQMEADGYASATINDYRQEACKLIVWLHLFRIRLGDLTADCLEQFRNRSFACSIPGVYLEKHFRTGKCRSRWYLNKFLSYLNEQGRIAPVLPATESRPLPEILENFCSWLKLHRGLTDATIRHYVARIIPVVDLLGEDPAAYDTCLIRDAFRRRIENRSRSHARGVATSMRMYLRFLILQGVVPVSLLAAVPTVPQWRLSNLPRSIADCEVERTIASCSGLNASLRDRAILLLLARLALRAGDIVALRIGDIDWNRAEIRVTGKSKRSAALPLPQDVGDALYAYLATVRPKLDCDRVFVTSIAPYRPFADSGTVSRIVRRAFDRAQVTTPAGRGAHVLRHSRATGLLRSGTSLNLIQSLLRHESADTTMIYAKTDLPMLLEVAQPWIGGLER